MKARKFLTPSCLSPVNSASFLPSAKACVDSRLRSPRVAALRGDRLALLDQRVNDFLAVSSSSASVLVVPQKTAILHPRRDDKT